ncbi:sulfite transporter Ssu2 [Lojkania enalia]|uniref:Sulfite transporter Ssu2 n=1 Tax=Lojkania enalia TaxID=147567 RepID=A0A9P4N4F4_9PLEO|nr:sulfite transporter Ssu2 [Didymosphaeria enalia]
MDDTELEHIASDNPALETPAAQPILVRSRRSNRSTKTKTASSDAPVKPTKYDVGWRRVVRNFSPSWFSVTMGTGIVSLLFVTIPFKATPLYWLAVIFFCLNTILFFSALSISVLRYTLYPEIWGVMIADSTNSLFLGTIPMGFATLVEAWIFLCIPYWGPWAITLAWICWMIDCVVALAVTISMTVLLISASERQALHRITAAQLLPIAATIVASGTGAEIAKVLPNPEDALGTLIASYVLWGMSTPLAMAVLVMYYTRLALHKLPPREIVVSSFLPLGPLGMGGYTIMYLGSVSRMIFPQTHFFQDLATAGDIFYILGAFIALMMWGFGLTWLCFALASIYKSRPFPFNMGWWGFTFPLGVFAVSTIEFGVQMPSLFFKVLGTIFGTAVILLWCVVATRTVRGAWDGRLFHAPCLANLPKKEEDKGEEERVESEKGLQG